MSKRLQVIFDDREYEALQAVARTQHMTMAEWVRQTLRSARREQPLETVRSKLDAIEVATRYEFPTGDIDQLLEQTEQGYAKGLSE
jgi:hypothetical protein